jgi:hypothetical protein
VERDRKEPIEVYVSEEGKKSESVIALNLGSVRNDSDTSDKEVVESDKEGGGGGISLHPSRTKFKKAQPE